MTIENFNAACDGIDDVMNFVMCQNTKMVFLEDQNKQLSMTISADRENYDYLAKEYREVRDERQRMSEVLTQERLLSTNTAKQLEEAMDEIRKLRAVLSNITEALKPVVEPEPKQITEEDLLRGLNNLPTEPPFLPPAKEPEPASTHDSYGTLNFPSAREHKPGDIVYVDPYGYPMLPNEAEAHKDDYIPLPRAVGDEYRF